MNLKLIWTYLNDEFNLYGFVVKQLLKSRLILTQFFLIFMILGFITLLKVFRMLQIYNLTNRKNHQCKKIQTSLLIIDQISIFN